MPAGTLIKHKRKAGAFTTGQLAAGEFGVDTTNGAVYFSHDGSAVTAIKPVSNTAYNASTWDGVADVAPSQNAVRDQFEAEPSAERTLTAKKYELNGGLGTNNTYEGMTIAGKNAGATIAQWDLVRLNSSSNWVLADANVAGSFPAHGMAVAAYSNGNAAIVLVKGVVRNDSWNWTAGGTLYLSTTAGGLTQTQPSATDDCIQVVGFALDAGRAFFNFVGNYITKT